jgi:hypothetical protein
LPVRLKIGLPFPVQKWGWRPYFELDRRCNVELKLEDDLEVGKEIVAKIG